MSGVILLIDDHKPIGRLLDLLLQRGVYAHYELHSVLSLEDALTFLESQTPDLIILDNILMPYSNYQIPLAELREVTNAPVVLMTGSDRSELGIGDKLPDGICAFQLKSELSVEALDETLAIALGDTGVRELSA